MLSTRSVVIMASTCIDSDQVGVVAFVAEHRNHEKGQAAV